MAVRQPSRPTEEKNTHFNNANVPSVIPGGCCDTALGSGAHLSDAFSFDHLQSTSHLQWGGCLQLVSTARNILTPSFVYLDLTHEQEFKTTGHGWHGDGIIKPLCHSNKHTIIAGSRDPPPQT